MIFHSPNLSLINFTNTNLPPERISISSTSSTVWLFSGSPANDTTDGEELGCCGDGCGDNVGGWEEQDEMGLDSGPLVEDTGWKVAT